MAESRPGRGDVPRGNGAGLANASGKNAGMRLKAFPSAPWPVPCRTLPRSHGCRDAGGCSSRLGRGFAGGARGSCLEMAGTPARVGDAACREPFGVLPGWVASWAVLGAPEKSSRPWSSVTNVIFPRTPVCARFRGERLHFRGRGREGSHSSFSGDGSVRRGGVSERAPAPREPTWAGLGTGVSGPTTAGTRAQQGAATARTRQCPGPWDSQDGSGERPWGAMAAPTPPPAPRGLPGAGPIPTAR